METKKKVYANPFISVTPRQLGFTEATLYGEMVEVARKQGLLAPAESLNTEQQLSHCGEAWAKNLSFAFVPFFAQEFVDSTRTIFHHAENLLIDLDMAVAIVRDNT